MKKKKAIKVYKKLAKKLYKLHTDASAHISRKDNNRVFEISIFFRSVARRIKEEYYDTNY